MKTGKWSGKQIKLAEEEQDWERWGVWNSIATNEWRFAGVLRDRTDEEEKTIK